MTTRTVTLQLPENVYTRLQQTARATHRPLDEVLLHAMQVGSPPWWDDAPAEFQADLAALDRLDDESLWQIARRRLTDADIERYQELLDKNANGVLSADERDELVKLRVEFDRFMLCKAQAVALLRWRGYQVPPAEALSDVT
jgi:hypothetical protein